MPETKAIADSGPLISLARINQLELLPRLFASVSAPPAVWKEVTAGGQDLPGSKEILLASWIKIQTPDPQLVRLLGAFLGAGEAEAIALAHNLATVFILLAA